MHATAGNISVRLEDSEGGGFLITPADACLGFLDPARLMRLSAVAPEPLTAPQFEELRQTFGARW